MTEAHETPLPAEALPRRRDGGIETAGFVREARRLRSRATWEMLAAWRRARSGPDQHAGCEPYSTAR